MVQTNEFQFRSSNGESQVYVKTWAPQTAPRAVLQIAHGIAEHIGRYDAFARFLAEQGFFVVGNDHLGHGRTANGAENFGFFSDTDGWMHVSNDMRKLTNLIQQRYPALPCFLFGHSMGSFLARTYLIRWQTGLSGVILSGTGNTSMLLLRLGRRIARREIIAHGRHYRSERLQRHTYGSRDRSIKLPRTIADWISTDEAAVDEYINDPLSGFTPTVGLFADMLNGIRYNQHKPNLRKMNSTLPILLVSGARDPLGKFGRGINQIAAGFRTAGSADVTVKLYPHGRHEMLHETNREEVYSDLLVWLESKL